MADSSRTKRIDKLIDEGKLAEAQYLMGLDKEAEYDEFTRQPLGTTTKERETKSRAATARAVAPKPDPYEEELKAGRALMERAARDRAAGKPAAYKKGGLVTPRGCGCATKGFGKAGRK